MIRDIQTANPRQKPIALWLYADGIDQQARALANEPYVACFASIDEAVMGLAALYRYRRFVEQVKSQPSLFVSLSPKVGATAAVPKDGVLVGEAALDVLRHYNIPGVPGEMAVDAGTAAVIADRLEYPVVIKIVSPQWLHKSDLEECVST